MLHAASAIFDRPSAKSPLFVLGWGKCGSSSLQEYFNCGGYNASHWSCGSGPICGACIRENILRGRPILQGCDGYDAYTQIDMANPPRSCFIPQYDTLDAIHREYPRSTWILNTRPEAHWLKSIRNWNNVVDRMRKCGFLNDTSDAAILTMYRKRNNQVREFWSSHQTHPLIELDIESAYAAKTLLKHFGIPESCWGDLNSRLDQPREPSTLPQSDTP